MLCYLFIFVFFLTTVTPSLQQKLSSLKERLREWLIEFVNLILSVLLDFNLKKIIFMKVTKYPFYYIYN